MKEITTDTSYNDKLAELINVKKKNMRKKKKKLKIYILMRDILVRKMQLFSFFY